MYSLEDRLRAVQLYIESGCSEGTVIRELGYPSHAALRNWYKEYLREGNLHPTSAPKPRYTEQEKAAAVVYFETHKTTLTQTCRAMGYPSRYVLRKWILEINPALLNRNASSCDSKKTLVFKPMREILKRSEKGFRNWKNSCVPCRWKTTMQCLPCVVACAASTNGWHLWTACNTARV